MEGKASIQKWYQNFMDQFPKIKFTLKNISVKNIFDFVRTNVVTTHWDVDLTNRNGKEIQNSGITMINLKFGKALWDIDYIFDTGDKLKSVWGVT